MKSKAGYLSVLGLSKKWKARWFDICRGGLCYYADCSKHNPLGIIILQEGQIISADFVDRPHCFILDLSTESYVFQAATKEEKEEWIEVLSDHVEVLKSNGREVLPLQKDRIPNCNYFESVDKQLLVSMLIAQQDKYRKLYNKFEQLEKEYIDKLKVAENTKINLEAWINDLTTQLEKANNMDYETKFLLDQQYATQRFINVAFR